ncbi:MULTISPECIES: Com family DNA-binding transcriptional regulator [Gulbenkiania]|uniref:Com family DNA-binding transcriptional regulator n=1 Tax=Gulbenkiania TaxID=397456 RepID=UPI0009313315|nr:MULTISPECIES: Com family DNA-binding transcriptional regulator [Gulbenkiania]
MQDIRCGHCQRKLAEGRYIEITIKCPRCGTMNSLRAASPTPERRRAPTPGENHGRQSDHPLAGRKAPPGRQAHPAFPTA